MLLVWDDLKRAIWSKGFLITVIAVFLMLFVDGYENLKGGVYDSLVYFFDMLTGIGSLNWLLPCVGTFCYAACFLKDKETGSLKYFLARGGVCRYSCSKVLACFVAGFCAMLVAIALYLLYAYRSIGVLFVAEYAEQYKSLNTSFYSLLANGRPLAYLCVHVLCRCLCGGMWTVFGLMLSTIWQNVYVAYFAPAVIVYFKDYLYAWLQIRVPIYLKELEWGLIHISGTMRPLLLIAGVFIALSCIWGTVFTICIRRQAEC